MAKKYTTEFFITASTAGTFKAAFSNAAKTLRQTQTYAKSLQKEMDNLKQAYQAGKVDALNYAKTMDNLTKAYERQQKAAKALGQVEKTQALKDKVDNVRDKAGGLAVKAGAAAVATLGLPIKEAMAFEDVMADVRKVVDFDSPEQFKQMGNDIKAMSAVLPMSAEGIAQIVAAGGQAGIAREDLKAFAADAVKMGVAFDMSAEEAGQTMAEWRTAFKMSQPEVVNLADKVNYLSNTTAASSAKISDIVSRVGPLGAVGGLASGEIAALGATMAAAGTESEVAATGIQKIILAMTTGEGATKSQAAAFSALGLDAVDMAKRMQTDASGALQDVFTRLSQLDKYQQAAVLKDLFGAEGIKAIAPLLTNLDALRNNLANVTDQSKYAQSMQKEFDTRMQATSNSAQLAKNSINNLGTTIGNALLPTVKSLLDRVTPMVQRIANFANEHQTLTAVVVGGIGGLLATVAAISGLTWIITSIASPILSAKKAWEAYRAAQLLSTTATNTHTLASIRNAIATKATGVAARISAIGHTVYNTALATGSKLMSIGRIVAYHGAIIATSVATKAATVGQYMYNGAMVIGRGLMSVGRIVAYSAAITAVRGVTMAWTGAQWLLNAAMLANPVGLVIAGIAGLIAVGYLLVTNWDTIKSRFTTLWNDPETAIAQFCDGVKSLLGSTGDWIMEKWQSIKDFLSHPIDGTINIVKNMMDNGNGSVENHNAKGGIYGKGAFTTWFAEDSAEAAIPLDGKPRSISLWTKAGQMLGILPQAMNEPTAATSHNQKYQPRAVRYLAPKMAGKTAPTVNAPRMLENNTSSNNETVINPSFTFHITVNGDSTESEARNLAAMIEREVLKILDKIKRKESRVAYGN